MQTMNLTKEQLRTANKLTAMFTENTGKHMLDSGGAYGRNWERNQGLTTEHFLTLPDATWERNWGFTIEAWSFCRARLDYTKTAEVLSRLMNVWELADYDNRNLYHGGDQEEYLNHLGAERIEGFNTYNYENALSQTLQGYTFELMGLRFVLLQVHGGCDVRGGYTLPVIFETDTDWFLYGIYEVSLYCDNCELAGGTYDTGAWYYHGELEPDLFGQTNPWSDAPDGYDYLNGCPQCGGDLTATQMEGY